MPRHAHTDLVQMDAAMLGAVDRIIAAHRHTPGAIVTVLRQVHAATGRLSPPLLDHIAAAMNLPPRWVRDTAAYHSRFLDAPQGRHKVRLCRGAACGGRGIEPVWGRVRQALRLEEGAASEDRRFSLEAVHCLGACGMAPVMVVDQDTYGAVAPEQVLEILEKYR